MHALPANHDSGSPHQSADADRLFELERLAGADIETSLLADLSADLHSLFDPISDDVLPIYFGPLLGRLYLNSN